ncbi:esterase-like protein [Macrophomina phaseolina]|uniref:Esterase-like protein n=1 Tax=Macrophomina phaseolina TaxID=35725 RepID=A0ABQ8G2M3_9PEZI|nr:esterase-like protein [Macrophomina phaseolina]
MHDKNPTQIQFAPRSQRPLATPLVLVHDGGGTTFGYFSLGNLHRDVWAIHNPHFFTAEPWEGGMDEMARHYIGLIENAGISGPIFLGGWSLGGFLSLAMARMLAAKPSSSRISVAGLLIIDSPFHIPWSAFPAPVSAASLPGLPDLVRKSLDNCDGLLASWQLPEWDGDAGRGRELRCAAAATIPPVSVLYTPLRRERTLVAVQPFPAGAAPLRQDGVAPPPGVLLRCVERVPSEEPRGPPCRVDYFRDELVLGWDGRHPEFIKAVFDVDSHHYNIFDFKKVKQVTAQLNEALTILECASAAGPRAGY